MNPCNDAVSAFAALCEMEPPAITGQEIEEGDDGPCYERLRSIHALVEIDRSASIVCFACEQPHAAAVEYVREGTYRYYCRETGFHPMPANWLRRFAVRQEWIAGVVRVGLGDKPGNQGRIHPRCAAHRANEDRSEIAVSCSSPAH